MASNAKLRRELYSRTLPHLFFGFASIHDKNDVVDGNACFCNTRSNDNLPYACWRTVKNLQIEQQQRRQTAQCEKQFEEPQWFVAQAP